MEWLPMQNAYLYGCGFQTEGSWRRGSALLLRAECVHLEYHHRQSSLSALLSVKNPRQLYEIHKHDW